MLVARDYFLHYYDWNSVQKMSLIIVIKSFPSFKFVFHHIICPFHCRNTTFAFSKFYIIKDGYVENKMVICFHFIFFSYYKALFISDIHWWKLVDIKWFFYFLNLFLLCKLLTLYCLFSYHRDFFIQVSYWWKLVHIQWYLLFSGCYFTLKAPYMLICLFEFSNGIFCQVIMTDLIKSALVLIIFYGKDGIKYSYTTVMLFGFFWSWINEFGLYFVVKNFVKVSCACEKELFSLESFQKWHADVPMSSWVTR